MTLLRLYRWEIIVASLALFVHALCFYLVLQAQGGSVIDTVRADDGYFELAQNVLAGNGFSWDQSAPYEPNPLRTPGHVYVLAALLWAFGFTGAALIQLVAASVIPVLGMWIARYITGSSHIGIAAGLILALDPTLALLSFQFYTETLFLILFFTWLLITFRYLERRDWTTLAASAFILGCAILVRTGAQYIPLLMIPFILWQFGRMDWRRGTLHAGMYLLIVGAILTPWIVRNATTFGVPGLSAQTPFILYTNLAPAVLSVARGSDFLEERDSFLTPEEYKGDAITLANGPRYTAAALDVVRAYPLATLLVTSKSLFTFFTNDGVYTLLVMTGYEAAEFTWLLFPARLVWVAITLAAAVGALVYFVQRRSSLAIFIIVLVAYFAATSMIAAFGTNPRYRLPVDPIILALGALGASYLYQRARNIWKNR